MLRRRSVQQGGLPLYAGNPSCPDYDSKSKEQRSSHKAFIGKALSFLLFMTITSILGLLFFKSSSSSTIKQHRYLYGPDGNEHCTDWAERGECHNNRVFMLSNCPEACWSRAGISIDVLSQDQVYEDATQGFAHFIHNPDENDEKDCVDFNEDCEEMAQEGKCLENADYMLSQCRKSCLACFGTQRTTVTIDFGVEQTTTHKDATVQEEIRNVITKTRDYMVEQVFGEPQFEAVRRDCRNLDPHCSIYAAMGECHGTNDALQMFQNCAPACHACNAVEYYRRCSRRPEQEDVFAPGDLNGMFERIVSTYPKTTALSQPVADEELSDDELPMPWVLVLDDFVSNDECDWFIHKGRQIGFSTTSEITDEINEDGTFGNKIGQGRTSTDAWCEAGCEDEPMAKGVLERMLNLTGIPHENTEYLEILKYETGGHYERHHDMIATQGPERCGNRMLTFYLFLSDVEEGGQLRFTEIEKDVQPKKGRAVLWQNVLGDDFEVMQTLTFHEAKPVKRGQKYGANLWFHPRNMREAMEFGCC